MLSACSRRGGWRLAGLSRAVQACNQRHPYVAHVRVLSVSSLLNYLIRPDENGETRARGGMQGLSELLSTQRLPTKSATYDLKTAVTSPPKWDVVFLGTCAMRPSLTRNVSSVLLKFGATSWLFDCGDGTQQQMMRANLNPGKISRIFISHFHGDHLFGLPGLICSINVGKEQGNKKAPKAPLEIYGPPGLRKWLRLTLSLSNTWLNYKYVVHELHAVPPAPDEDDKLHASELQGKNLIPDESGLWMSLFSHNKDLDIVSVHAALLKHRAKMPTFGFVLKETDYPGSMNADVVMSRFDNETNKAYFREKGGPGLPGKLVGDLKRGEPVQLADGILRPEECLGPTKTGRKVAILSDTSDPSNIASLCAGASLVIHEATECGRPSRSRPLDVGKLHHNASAKKRAAKRAVTRGHSTPEMAATFAQTVQAESLALTHFSGRFHGFTNSSVKQDKSQAFADAIRGVTGESYDGQVIVAHDLLMLEVRADWARDWKEGAEPARQSYNKYRPWSREPEIIVPASIYTTDKKPFSGDLTAEQAALRFAKAIGRPNVETRESDDEEITERFAESPAKTRLEHN